MPTDFFVFIYLFIGGEVEVGGGGVIGVSAQRFDCYSPEGQTARRPR